MARDINTARVDGSSPLQPRRKTTEGAQTAPISADAAERRARMSADGKNVAGGTGRSGMTLDGKPRGRDPEFFDRFIMNQYDGSDQNACGTTSMSMVLNYWKNEPGAYNHGQIDHSVRRGPDMFSSPSNLIDYARSQGFRSEGKNNSSIEDLKGYLDQGVPVQVLIDPDDDGGDMVLHYVNVVDYEADADGNITDLVIADPAGGDRETMPVEEFEEKWGDLHMKGVDAGLNNMMIVTLPGENQQVMGKDGVMRNSDDIELPPQAPFWQRALGIQFGVGAGLADGFADLMNKGAAVVDGAKAVGGAIVDGAKAVGRFIGGL